MSHSYFHLHLISDTTGESLINAGRAAAAQYEGVSAIEHIYPLVRSGAQLQRVLLEIGAAPGLILYTFSDQNLIKQLELAVKDLGSPLINVLRPAHGLSDELSVRRV